MAVSQRTSDGVVVHSSPVYGCHIGSRARIRGGSAGAKIGLLPQDPRATRLPNGSTVATAPISIVESFTVKYVAARKYRSTFLPLEELTESTWTHWRRRCASARRTPAGWRQYRGALHAARAVLYHLGVLREPPGGSGSPGCAQVRAPPRRGPRAAAPELRWLSGAAHGHPRALDRDRHGHPPGPLRPTPGRGRSAPAQPGPARPPVPHRVVSHRGRRGPTRLADGAPISASERRARAIPVKLLLSDIA
jgi:hypothetical protein